MSKVYRVVNVDGMEEYGVKLGDTCSREEDINASLAWFYSPTWIGDGIWALYFSNLEEVVETN